MSGWRDRIVGTLKLVLGSVVGGRRLERAGRMHLLLGATQGAVDEVAGELRNTIIPISRASSRRLKRVRPSRR